MRSDEYVINKAVRQNVAENAGRKQLGGSRDGACTRQLLNWSGLVLTDWNRIGSIQLLGS